ncbi:unnamed protein product, partial [Musa acuminata subsp. burmannicoides]
RAATLHYHLLAIFISATSVVNNRVDKRTTEFEREMPCNVVNYNLITKITTSCDVNQRTCLVH